MYNYLLKLYRTINYLNNINLFFKLNNDYFLNIYFIKFKYKKF